jgi:hypothetical protein
MPMRTCSEASTSVIGYGIDNCERCAHGLFGVILLRPWIAEIGKDPIAHISSYHALVSSDNRTDTDLIGVDHPPHVFRVQPSREGGRADHVAKHQCQVTALGLFRPRGPGRSFGRCKRSPVKFGNGPQQSAAMPQHDAEALEVLLCQIANDREVNRVLGEELGVLSEPDRFQPLVDTYNNNYFTRRKASKLPSAECFRIRSDQKDAWSRGEPLGQPATRAQAFLLGFPLARCLLKLKLVAKYNWRDRVRETRGQYSLVNKPRFPIGKQ